jgi:S1-C subfamily serine protease
LKRRQSVLLPCGSLVLAALGFGIAGCGGGGGDDETTTLDPQAVIEAASPATAGILGEQFGVPTGGSGVVIDAAQRLVLTNAHVVEGLDKLQVKLGDDQTLVPREFAAWRPATTSP